MKFNGKKNSLNTKNSKHVLLKIPGFLKQIKNYTKDIKPHLPLNKMIYWGKAISITGIAQIIVQAVGFLSGILIIRLLSIQEYAFYTLANTMLGTMTLLADSGVSSSVMAQGGKVWKHNEKLGVILSTGLNLRSKFAIISLIISTPVLIYLLLHNGASWSTAILIALALIPAFYAALSDSLLEIVPKLHQAILPLQKNQMMVGISRLLLTGVTVFFFPWTFVAILANGIPRLYGNFRLKKISYKYVEKSKQIDPLVRKEIMSLVLRQLPAGIYYTISGQLTIWLISFMGNSSSIAQIGALTRFSVMFSVFSVIIGTLIVPRFAKLENNRKQLLKYFLILIILYFILCFFILFFTWLFSNQLLFILGTEYSELNYELILVTMSSCLGLIAGYTYHLTVNRAWVLNPLLNISISILSTIIGIYIFDTSTLVGVLYLSIFINIFQMLKAITYGVYKINKVNT